MNLGHGLVIGKFYPPHRGHHYLIRFAESRCDRVTAIVCGRANDAIPGALRADWLREIHPNVEILVLDDRYDPDDSRLWAELTLSLLGRAPDAVFTSEDYGDRYARYLGCEHILVDKNRVHIPCSGTLIRANPWAAWEYVEPPVRAWYVKRVCVLGAESTGTTTTAAALADRFGTCWVPEYGREYCEKKFGDGGAAWTSDEFTHIALEQCRREDLAARLANRVLFCDTNAFATNHWHRRYLGRESDEVARISSERRYDLYLLTGDEIPFVQDGLRDGEHVRHEMHRRFEESLRAQRVPWLLLEGPLEQRLAVASLAVQSLFPPAGA